MGRLPKLTHGIQQIYTKSVLNPLLALSAIAIPCLVVGAWSSAKHADFFLWCIVGILVFVCVAYGYWAIADPDRLQSEETYTSLRQAAVIGDDRANPAGEIIEGVATPVANTSISVTQAVSENK